MKMRKLKLETNNPEIVLMEPVPEDKFDNHMKEARESTEASRHKILVAQSKEAVERKKKYGNITPSIY